MAKLWTIEGVAEYWGVSKYTVLRLIRKNRINAISVGKGYRIPEDEVRKGARKQTDC